jgi:hypothetical protein
MSMMVHFPAEARCARIGGAGQALHVFERNALLQQVGNRRHAEGMRRQVMYPSFESVRGAARALRKEGSSETSHMESDRQAPSSRTIPPGLNP